MAFGQTQASLLWELQLVPQYLYFSLLPDLFSLLDFFFYLGFKFHILIPLKILVASSAGQGMRSLDLLATNRCRC